MVYETGFVVFSALIQGLFRTRTEVLCPEGAIRTQPGVLTPRNLSVSEEPP
jgi:hypothetical protein